jgi:hypothetical protein
MAMFEYAGNLHMHTRHSDGAGSHEDLVRAAAAAGLVWIIVTDHNVWSDGVEGWYEEPGGRRVLLLMGEEVHDPDRQPQANHLLCFGIHHDVSALARDPQALLDAVNAQGGVAFLAHPIEHGTKIVNEELPWVDWHVTGYAGIEIWNYMSEFKALTTDLARAVGAAFLPHWFIRGPFPETLALWDRLMNENQGIVVGIGGADAHANVYRLGPLRRTVFPYHFLFKTVNTHLLSEEPLTGDLTHDRALIVQALRAGRCWVGYDGLAPTEGTRFLARQGDRLAPMGEMLSAADGPVTFHFVVPGRGELRLLRNGEVVAQVNDALLTHTDARPGVYRAEAWRRAWGRTRGWVFTNPIRLC